MVDNTNTESRSEQSTAQLTNDELLAIYEQVCTNIRTTDEISFKLLGAVPFASGVGAGALTILEKSNLLKGYTGYAVLALSLLGAVIILALFKWELRNIQRCSWFIARAAKIEQRLHSKVDNLQYDGMASPASLSAIKLEDVRTRTLTWKWSSWGKTEAEKLIYSAAFVAWLIPMAIVVTRLINTL